MRTITVRQFQRQLYKELKDVPLVVTKQQWVGPEGNKHRQETPEFIVIPYSDEAIKSLPEEMLQTEKNEPIMRTEEVKEGIKTKLGRLFNKTNEQ